MALRAVHDSLSEASSEEKRGSLYLYGEKSLRYWLVRLPTLDLCLLSAFALCFSGFVVRGVGFCDSKVEFCVLIVMGMATFVIFSNSRVLQDLIWDGRFQHSRWEFFACSQNVQSTKDTHKSPV